MVTYLYALGVSSTDTPYTTADGPHHDVPMSRTYEWINDTEFHMDTPWTPKHFCGVMSGDQVLGK